jgi:hypothetical protein
VEGALTLALSRGETVEGALIRGETVAGALTLALFRGERVEGALTLALSRGERVEGALTLAVSRGERVEGAILSAVSWAVPRFCVTEITDAEAGLAEVVAAASALALSGLPAESQPLETFAAEEGRRHAHVAGVIPVLPLPGHLSGTVGTQGGEAVLARELLNQACDATSPEHNVVVEEHYPRRFSQSFRPVSCPRDRRETIGVFRRRRSRKAVDAQINAILKLNSTPDILT